MKLELEEKLLSSYPKIFRQKDLPMNQTCMCWGIECGDGWYTLLNALCNHIQHYLDQKKDVEQVEAVQVKEKYGTLRFYINGGDDYVDGLVSMAENMSAFICEQCGDAGSIRGKGWYTTRCDECHGSNSKEAP